MQKPRYCWVGQRTLVAWLGRGRVLILVLLTGAYPVVSYIANVSGRPGIIGVMFAFLPLLALLMGAAWSATPRRLWLALYAGVCLVLWRYRFHFVAHYSWAFLAEDAGTLMLLCAVFARTLMPGSVPLVSRLSALIHGPLSPLVLRYTRHVTELWALLFGIMGLMSLLLFLLAPLPLWAFYANVLTPPIMMSVFVGEYMVRRRIIPHDQRTGFAEAFRASHKYWRTIVDTDHGPVAPTPRTPQ